MKLKHIFFYLIIMAVMNSCNYYMPGFDYKLFDDTPVKELAQAVKKDDLEKIEFLVKEKKMNINHPEPKFGNTLLSLAIVNQKAETVEALLKLGADPNQQKFKNTDTPFLNAVEFTDNQTCNSKKVKLLLDYGADVNSVFIDIRELRNGGKQDIQHTALMIACRNRCLNLVKLLIARGADINQYTYYEGYGSITSALMQDNLEIAKYIIVDKKARIPEYIFQREAGITHVDDPAKRLTITDMLNESDYSNQPEKQKYKEEILSYLESIGKQ